MQSYNAKVELEKAKAVQDYLDGIVKDFQDNVLPHISNDRSVVRKALKKRYGGNMVAIIYHALKNKKII